MKQKFEIINPSDECYLFADFETQKEALCAAGLLLGRGQYALHCAETDNQVLPFFIFGGLDEWWLTQFGRAFEKTLKDRSTVEKMVEIFDSFSYPSERTSLNNIGEAAKTYADMHRKWLEGNSCAESSLGGA